MVQLHPSTLTGVIQRLVVKQLLVRERDAKDTRVVRLRVAKKAGRFVIECAGGSRRRHRARVPSLNAEEIRVE